MHRGCVVTCLIFTLVISAFVSAEQYRSRVLLDPNASLLESQKYSIAELEASLSTITDGYSAASAGRFLARHFVEQQQWDKAIQYYQEALAKEGLSVVANREMLRELTAVLLMKGEANQAVSTAEKIAQLDVLPEPDDALLLAQAYYSAGNYLNAARAIDTMLELDSAPSIERLQQALAVYYKVGNYPRSQQLLQQLIQAQPQQHSYWLQLVTLYLQQNNLSQALAWLTIAYEQQIPFTTEQRWLLTDLYANTGQPYMAATLLQQWLDQQQIEPHHKSYFRLFQYWLLARDSKLATQALAKAVAENGDAEQGVYLAKLLTEQLQWQQAKNAILQLCRKPIPQQYVGALNLYLGISEVRLGNRHAGRTALIDATLLGGAASEAANWMKIFGMPAATPDELDEFSSPCAPQDRYVGQPAGTAKAAQLEVDNASFTIKEIEPLLVYTSSGQKPLKDMSSSLRGDAIRMTLQLVKNGGSVDGPLHLLISSSQPEGGLAEGEQSMRVGALMVKIALPAKGSTIQHGRYSFERLPAFRCASKVIQGTSDTIQQSIIAYIREVAEMGYAIADTHRIVIIDSSSDSQTLEVQIGIL